MLLTWPRAPLLTVRPGSAPGRRSWAGTPIPPGCWGMRVGSGHARPGPALPFPVAFRGTPGHCWPTPTPPGAGASGGSQTFLLGLPPPALLQVQLADQPPALLQELVVDVGWVGAPRRRGPVGRAWLQGSGGLPEGGRRGKRGPGLAQDSRGGRLELRQEGPGPWWEGLRLQGPRLPGQRRVLVQRGGLALAGPLLRLLRAVDPFHLH